MLHFIVVGFSIPVTMVTIISEQPAHTPSAVEWTMSAVKKLTCAEVNPP